MKKFGNRENESVILNDGREVWLSRSVAVVAIVTIVHNGITYVLMGKRGPGCPNEIGKWVMPCGYLDYDETLNDAAIRETFEETGFHVPDYLSRLEEDGVSWIDKQLYSDWDIPVHIKSSYTKGTGAQNVTVYFRLELPEIVPYDTLPKLTISNPQEVTELKWVPLEEVPKLEVGFGHDETISRLVRPRNYPIIEYARRASLWVVSRLYDFLR